MKMKLKPRPCPAQWRSYEKPEGTVECRQIIDGWLRTWQEYVPSCYDGCSPVPLVLSVHGAAHHNADIYTAWQLIAERENFIVVYPHCLIEEIKFNVWRAFTKEDGMPDDVQYFDDLIDIIKEKYNIDETRIYLQGQSVGDNMVSSYIFERGDKIAAAAPLSGPASASVFVDEKTGEIFRKPSCPLPVIRTHGSEDTQQPLGSLGKICIMSPKGAEGSLDYSEEARRNKWVVSQKINIDLWREANGCNPLPKLSMRGRYNWLVYEGDPCDFIFYIVEGGEHGPYLDMADNIWSGFFTAYRRVDRKIVKTEPQRPARTDQGGIALADNAVNAYVNNELVKLDEQGHEAKLIDGAFYTPVTFLERAFDGVTVELYEQGTAAVIRSGEDRLQAAMGNRSMVFNEMLRDMMPTLYFDDMLYIPFGDVARTLFGYKAALSYGAGYFCDHDGVLSYDMAYVIRELLGTEPVVTPKEMLELEMELRREKSKQYSAHNVAEGAWSGAQDPEEIFKELKKRYERSLKEYLK